MIVEVMNEIVLRVILNTSHLITSSQVVFKSKSPIYCPCSFNSNFRSDKRIIKSYIWRNINVIVFIKCIARKSEKEKKTW